VKDTGCGIAEEDQSKLLHTDTHFSTFGTNNEEGSGLGLLLCQDFVEKNNGKLWFTSKKGEGSTFSFSIPLKEEEE
jgi:two-component system sensor histidine kinase/response regulator